MIMKNPERLGWKNDGFIVVEFVAEFVAKFMTCNEYGNEHGNEPARPVDRVRRAGCDKQVQLYSQILTLPNPAKYIRIYAPLCLT
jgi:hypothetical protein